jgi:L-alanine-DL-glutamate epimerase-like enolase superfamily enzyme
MAQPTIRIVRVQTDELDPGPMPRPFVDATSGPFTHWALNWLRLTADDGVVGQGLGALHPLVVEPLLNDGPLTIDAWWHRLFWILRNTGHRNPAVSGCISAVDMALRDIAAQRAGLPWHRYHGATRDSVEVYGSGCGVNLTMDEMLAEARGFKAAGYRTMKMKVATDFGRRLDEDIERVRAVREAIGDGMGLAVDANQALDANTARDFARKIAAFDIAWFEEPVHSADRAALRDLCRDCPIPVAMGENENHWLGFRDLAECGTPHLQACPQAIAGFDRWREAIGFATTTWTAGGITPFTAMYVATTPGGGGSGGGGMVEYLEPVIAPLMTCFTDCPAIENGRLTLPTTPGVCMSINANVIVCSLVDRKR